MSNDERAYYCPKCGRVIANGYPGSVCYHGGRGEPTRMKPSGGSSS